MAPASLGEEYSPFATECYVYNHVLPEFEKVMKNNMVPENGRVRWPKVYMTIDTENQEEIIMEDVGANGYMLVDIEFKTLDWKHLKMVVEHLAKFDGLSYVLKSRHPAAFKKFSENCSEKFLTGNLFRKKIFLMDLLYYSSSRALEYIENPILAQKIRDFRKPIVKTICELSHSNFVSENGVFCHGNTWIHKYAFKYDKDHNPVELCLIDFQFVRSASPLNDIMCMIATSTDTEVRKKHYDDIFEHYHSSLRLFLNNYSMEVEDIYPKSQFLADREKYAPYGLFMGFCILCGYHKEFDNDEPLVGSASIYGRMVNDLVNDFDKYGYF